MMRSGRRKVDIVELTGFNERGERRPVLGAGEEGILAIEGERPDGALDGVGVDVDAAVLEEQEVYYWMRSGSRFGREGSY